MSFFQVDDDLVSNHKTRALIEGETFARAAVAGYLWTLAGSLSRKSGTDGITTLGAATSITLDRNAAKRGAALLVKYRLWHAPGHDCEACPQPPEGAWIFHQWFQFKYATGAAERVKADKLAELRNVAIIEAVWARDTGSDGVALCRYCATVVTRPAKGKGGPRRGLNIGWLDHVDPTKAIGSSNIVVTCQPCNQGKAQRTPEQADMVLRPAPTNTPTNTATNTGSTAEVSPTGARGGGDGVGPGLGRGGAAPVVPVASSWPSSPRSHHHGAPIPDDVIAATTCPAHHEPMPCRFCLAAGGAR